MLRSSLTSLLIFGLLTASLSFAAEKNPSTGLTKKHGPWMIMVCSFTVYNTEGAVGPEYEKVVEEQRKNGEKAAKSLIVELEKQGLPAFFYKKDDQVEEVPTRDRLGQQRTRKIKSQHGQMCVLAGNFDSFDDPKGQEWLQKLKVMKPKALKDGVFQAKSDKVGPLGGAFMTVNPLISPAELAELERKRDPLLKRLNSGSEYSLVKNPGKYTLIVASFKGKSQGIAMSASREEVRRKVTTFDRKLETDVSLDKAGYEAWSMAKAMRGQNQEAYVYHDRDRSIVTLGSFDDPEDPRLHKLVERMKARYITNPKTGKQEMTCEMVSLPARNPNDPPEKFWLLDPNPMIMPVPRLK